MGPRGLWPRGAVQPPVDPDVTVMNYEARWENHEEGFKEATEDS